MYGTRLLWAAGDPQPIRQQHASKQVTSWLALFGALCLVPLQASQASSDNITITMSSKVVRDGITRKSTPQAVNGAIMEFTVAVTGPSIGSTAAASFAINDDIPDQMALYVGDIAQTGSGPVAFIENDSGLNFAFLGLSSVDDALEFSNTGGQTFDYIPNPDSEGFDENVTHIRIAPFGMLMPVDSHEPRFSIQYRMRIN